MLWDQREQELPIIGLNKDQVIGAGHYSNRAFSKSALLHLCDPGTSLSHVVFNMVPGWYEPPWFLREAGMRGLASSLGGFTPNHFNGTTLSVQGMKPVGKNIEFKMQRSCYYSYLLTNYIADTPLIEGLSPRQLLEPGPALNSLDTAMAENHLGMSCLMRTSDGYLILSRRSQRVGVFAGQLGPSISGAANISACDDGFKGYTASAWLRAEIREEMPFLIKPNGEIDSEVIDLSKVRVLGMTREMIRCGKPELFFSYELPVNRDEMLDIINTYSGSSIGASLGHVDFVENDGFCLVHESEFFDTLEEEPVITNKAEGQQPTIKASGVNYKVSESLLSNAFLLRLS